MGTGILHKSARGLRLYVLLFFVFLLEIPLADPVWAVGVAGDQAKEIQTRLSEEERRLKAINSREKDLLAQLSEIEQEVAQKRRSLNQLNGKVFLAKIEIKRLKQKLSDLGRSLKNVERRMAKRLVPLYKYARKGYIKILATATDLDQLRQRMKYLQAIMEEDGRLLARLADEERERRVGIRRIREQVARTEAVKEQEETRLSSLKKDLQKRVIKLMEVHKEKEFYESAVKELQREAKGLKRTIMNIEKRRTHKKVLPSRFEDSKGRLPFPLEGKVIRGGKLLGKAKLKLHKGIFIESSSSHAEVKAIFPGRVEFSGTLKGYGETIIINHGSRFFTISAHLSERKKEAGDAVGGEEVIGIVRGNRPSKGAGIYFEIRRAGKNLTPLKWLKVD